MVERLRIEETTVGWVPGVAVGVGNIFVRDWTEPDGRSGRGPTAKLALRPDDAAVADSELTVYRGMELELAGRRWRVDEVSLESQGSDNGYVELVALGD